MGTDGVGGVTVQGVSTDAPDPFRPMLIMTSVQTNDMTMPRAYAVIGGWDYEGEDFNSLRLFDYHSAAVAYSKELKDQGYDYTKLEMRWIEQIPALEEILTFKRAENGILEQV